MAACNQTDIPVLNIQEDPCIQGSLITSCTFYGLAIDYLGAQISSSFFDVLGLIVAKLEAGNIDATNLEEDNRAQALLIEALQNSIAESLVTLSEVQVLLDECCPEPTTTVAPTTTIAPTTSTTSTTTTTTGIGPTINPNYSSAACDTSGGFQTVTLMNGTSICNPNVYLESGFFMLPSQFYITHQGFSRLFQKDVTNQFAYPQSICVDCTNNTTTTTTTIITPTIWFGQFSGTGSAYEVCFGGSWSSAILYTIVSSGPFAPNTPLYTNTTLTTLWPTNGVMSINNIVYTIVNGYTVGNGQPCSSITTTSTTTAAPSIPIYFGATAQGACDQNQYFISVTIDNGATSICNTNIITANFATYGVSNSTIYIKSPNQTLVRRFLVDASGTFATQTEICESCTTTTTTAAPTTTTTSTTTAAPTTTTTSTTTVAPTTTTSTTTAAPGLTCPEGFPNKTTGNGTMTLSNGVTLTTTYTGPTLLSGSQNAFTACGNSFRGNNGAGGTMFLNYNGGPFTLKLTFSQPQSHIAFSIFGMGIFNQPGVTESYTFTTNGGGTQITELNGCGNFQVQGFNTLVGANTNGAASDGSGAIQVTSSGLFTEVTITGNNSGSLNGVGIDLHLCSNLIIE